MGADGAEVCWSIPSSYYTVVSGMDRLSAGQEGGSVMDYMALVVKIQDY